MPLKPANRARRDSSRARHTNTCSSSATTSSKRTIVCSSWPIGCCPVKSSSASWTALLMSKKSTWARAHTKSTWHSPTTWPIGCRCRARQPSPTGCAAAGTARIERARITESGGSITMSALLDRGRLRTGEQVRVAYDSLSSSYDRRWRGYIDASLSKTIQTLRLEGDERILDVACGTGELQRRLLAQWPRLHIVGVDISPKMLARAQAKHIAGDVTWREGNASDLPVADGQVDVVVCANSFHYFCEPTACLREFRRALASGGRLVLLDWCDDYLMCKLCSLWLRLTDPAF